MELPEASRFAEARMNDPEVAKQIALAEREAERERARKGIAAPKWRPRYSEWDLYAMLLREIREAIYSGRDATVAALGSKPKRVPILPSPETEVDRIKQQLHEQGQMEIIALFAPHALRR